MYATDKAKHCDECTGLSISQDVHVSKLLGLTIFLLLTLSAGLLVYLSEYHGDALWSFYWCAIGLFCAYAAFLTVWLVTKTIRNRLLHRTD